MKLVWSNGKRLEVRDVSAPIYTLIESEVPIKFNGYQIMEDSAARELVRRLRAEGAVAT